MLFLVKTIVFPLSETMMISIKNTVLPYILFLRKKGFSETFLPGSDFSLNLRSGTICYRMSLIIDEKLRGNLVQKET